MTSAGMISYAGQRRASVYALLVAAEPTIGRAVGHVFRTAH